jgi:hypothetical protein
MNLQVAQIKNKHIYLKSFLELIQLKKAIKNIKAVGLTDYQLSVLAKIPKDKFSQPQSVQQITNEVKKYLNDLMLSSQGSGLFYTEQYGIIFIIGSLSPLFLREVNGKTLGSFSMGLYGILRGLGASESYVESQLKTLETNNYLLILRGLNKELEQLELSS